MITQFVPERPPATSENLHRYTFRVSPDANKEQIKKLIQNMYGVKVVSVNTANYDGKRKQRYTKTGLQRGKTAAFKKAYVKVAEGETIDFYSNI